MATWALLLLGVMGCLGTEISLKTRPGTLFSIPLDFRRPKFSTDTPQWVKYEAGGLKGVAGESIGVYKFQISEYDGTEEVNVHIGVSPRDLAVTTDNCFHQKYFGRQLNLHEKITFGISGGFYTDGLKGSVLNYPSPCRERKRKRAAGHNRDKGEGDEILEMGSGEDDDEDEEEDEEDYEDEIEHPIGPLQPTPTLSFDHLETRNVDNVLATPAVTHTLTLASDFPLHYRHPPSSDLFPQEYGSGDFEIVPTTPIHMTPSAIPEIELTPTLAPEQPVLRKLIEKLHLPAGKVFKFNIANGYFSSSHPIIYFLQPTEKEGSLPDWVTLEDGVLIAWPSVADVSEYQINLVAQDTVTNGATINEIFLSVRQRQKSRNYNHEFELKFLKNSTQSHQEPLYKVIENIQKFTGGRDEGDLVVTKMDRSSDIISIRWTNESLLLGENQNKCPEQELKEIYLRLVNSSGSSSPSLRLIRQLSPFFIPKSVGMHLLPKSLCSGSKHSNITGIFPMLPTQNFPPTIQNPLDSLSTISGEFFIQKVKENFCYDPEDGETPFLQVKLFDAKSVEVAVDNWLQFDEKNQEFYGLPPPLTSGKREIEEYTLKCTDKKRKHDVDALEVLISPGAKTDYAADFRLHFQSTPPFLAPEIRKFMERLGRAMNQSLNDILVVSYQASDSDVQFLWHLRQNPTTEAELTQLRRIFLEDDGSVKNSFKELFKPEFNLTIGQIIPKGRLLGSGTQTLEKEEKEEESTPREVEGGATEEVPILLEDKGNTYLITYIIPAIIIGLLIFLALLLACLLSRKRKSLPRSSEEAKAFIKKGVPVIFQDELEENRGPRSHSPAVFREDHPPLPPEYRRSPIQQYQPPPPMNRMGGPRGGVRPGTHYRKPPPYLPS